MDHHSIIPYYYQIRADILSKIRKGEFKENQTIGSENDLAEEYQVSRHTIRKALDELVFSGFLLRKQGRGTYVAPQRITKDLTWYSSFVEDISSLGQTPDVHTLSKKVVTTTLEIAKLLEIPEDDRIMELKDLRLADGEPITLRTAYYPLRRLPHFAEEKFEHRAVIDVMQLSGVSPVKASRSMEIVYARSYEAKHLKVRVGFPLILWEGVTYTDDDSPIELTRALYRSDKFRFQFKQHRNDIVGARIEYSAIPDAQSI